VLEDRIALSSYFVDQANLLASDTGPGSSSQPFKTIQAAANRAVAGDSVTVLSGTYSEKVTLKSSGTSTAPVIFTTAPGASVTVSGQANGFAIANLSWITLHGFTITSTSSYGISVSGSAHITIDGNNVSYAGLAQSGKTAKGIYVSNTTDSWVSSNTAHHNSDTGIYLTNSSTGIQVVGNVAYSNASSYVRQANGIDVLSGGNTITGNISHDNEDSGIRVSGVSSANTLANNVLYANGSYGINVLQSTSQRVLANSIYNNSTCGIIVQGSSTGATLTNNILVNNAVNTTRAKGNLNVDSSSTSGTSLDYDLLYQSTSGVVQVVWAGTNYTSLSSFVTARGQETHGLQGDPLWVSASAGDFHLRADSPAIDSANANAAGEPSTDLEGRARVNDPATSNTGVGAVLYADRGAYEFQATPNTITGRVFQDSNGDGSQQTGEAGLSGRTVYLDANNNGVLDTGEATATTDSSGAYSFTNLDPATYRVREVLPTGWLQTTANPAAIVAGTTGQTFSGRDFGAFQQISLSGALFQDSNGDGSQQTGEARLSNWTVYLDANGNGTLDTGEATATTDSNGNYSFVNLGPGTYHVRQVVPTSWQQTTTNPVDVASSSGVNVSGVNFGAFQQISLSGALFQDSNGDGARQAGEPGLASWTVYLDANGNGTLDTGEATATTDSNGNYTFTNLGPGTYRVRQVLPTGWQQTTTNPVDVTSSSGSNVAGVNFGAFQQVTLSGVVFQDNNGDGTQQTGEPGLSGWTVYLDANGNGTLDTGEATATTDSNGNYAFSNLGPGTYRVRQVLPASWQQTTVDPADITISSGSNVAGVNFGAFQQVTLSGQVLRDDDGNGVHDPGEAGLAGWTVFLDTNGNGVLDDGETRTVTDSSGRYSIGGLGTGTYRVRQVLPAGWTQTTPDPDDVTASSPGVVSGGDFGVFEQITLSGHVFLDANGNGLQQAEAGLEGRAVQLLDTAGNVLATAISDADGNYAFANLGPGSYRVRQVLPDGWQQTTVDPADITTSSGSNVAGLDFGSFQLISISDQVFQDTNGNGIRDAGEPGLQGQSLALTAAAVSSSVLRPDHVVVVVMENHAYSDIIGAAAAPYINSLAGQGALMNNSFGLTHPSQPNYLYLFSGSNQGVTDDSLPIGPFAGPDLGGELIAAGLTFGGFAEDLPYVGSTDFSPNDYDRNHNPWVDFSDVPSQDNMPFQGYFPSDFTQLPTVSFVIPNKLHDMHNGTIEQGDTWLQQNIDTYAQWAKTHNSLLILTCDEDNGAHQNHVVTILVGEMVTPGQYGQQINHLSVLRTLEDMYDLPYAGASASATPITEGLVKSAGTSTTDDSGASTFAGLGPGTYRVRQVLPDGWTQTTPHPADIQARSGTDVSGVTFGAFQNVALSGRLFNDANGNGVQDAGEANLSGWAVYLDANNNGVLDRGETSTITDAAGAYRFGNLGPGTYRVRQEVQAGWQQTTADPADVTTASGTDVSSLDFGNSSAHFTFTVSGRVFQDSNANIQADAGESGLSGRTVYLDANSNGTLDTGELSTVTDGSGAYAFTGLGPGTFRVRQVLPDGWAQVTGDPTDITAIGGGSASDVNFGDVAVRYYVDQACPSASDTGPGSASQPFKTIQAAADRAVAGDTVLVAAGTYNEKVTVKSSGTAAAPVVFVAAPGSPVILTGGANGFAIANQSWVTVHGFTITSTSSYGISVSGSSNITIDGNDVSYAGLPVSGQIAKGIHLSADTNSTVSRNSVHHNTDSGIFLTNGSTGIQVIGNQTYANASQYARQAPGIDVRSSGNTIANNISHDNEDSGIQFYPGAVNNLVYNNVSYNNGDHGIDVSGPIGNRIIANTVYNNITAGINVEGGATGTTITNNISVDNALNPIRTKGNIRVDLASIAGTTLDYDLVYQHTPQVMIVWASRSYVSLQAMQAASGQESHGLQADPLWVAPAVGDLHLQRWSPAIDSANVDGSGQSASDVEGRARVNDPATTNSGVGAIPYADRGAYEFQATPIAIAGRIFQDSNGDGSQQAGESGLAGRTVYLDANNNGVLDTSEATATTDASGAYSFTNLEPGTYRVRQVVPAGWSQPTADPADVNFVRGRLVSTDFGVFRRVMISGLLFQDINANRLQGAGEAGLAGWGVRLLDGAGNLLATTVTDAAGGYAFTDLGPGTYRVRAVLPDGWTPTLTEPADIQVSSGTDVTGASFGFFPNNTILGQIFQDTNGDGAQQAGENGLAGREVQLLDADGNVLATASTDAGGGYAFTDLSPSTYWVRQVLTTGWVQTAANPADVTFSGIGTISEAAFGAFRDISLSGQLFQDVNGDGVRQPSEAGLSGWTVYLDANGNGTLDTGEVTATTDSSGNYSFTNLGPGTYRLRQILPTNWTQTTANPADVGARSGTDAIGVNFGSFPNNTILGQLFQDSNCDGVRQAGEPGLSGRTVYLDANGNGTLDTGEPTATTDAAGGYAFTNLSPGTYRVRQVLPAGWLQTTADPADSTFGGIGTIAATTFGAFQRITIGGLFFQDTNADGVRQAGEPGLSGWTVYLDANGNGTLDTGEATTTTDSSGAYAFSNLGPGTYRVREVLPDGWTRTTPAEVDVAASSGSDVSNVTFGNFQNVTITGTLFQDTNGDGVRQAGEPGLSGRTVYLDANGNGVLDTGERSAITDSSGAYRLTSLSPGTYRVRQVLPAGWLQTTVNPADITVSSSVTVSGVDFGTFQTITLSGQLFWDNNGDGLRNGTDAALVGRKVYLDANGNGVLDTGEATTTTDSSGAYAFSNLGPGTYRVRQVVETGWQQTTTNPADVTASSGTNAPGLSFGNFQKITLSGRVFRDSNGNTLADTGEAGLSGWTVYLDANHNGALDTGETSTSTDGSGAFSFTNLGPGTYRVREVVASGWARLTVNPVDVTAGPGSVSNLTFGNLPVSYYVDRVNPNASDTGPGSASQPFKTIQAAANKATAGSTVLVLGGTYSEKVTVKSSGTSTAPVVFTAADGASVTVSGGTNGFAISNQSWITLHGFTVTSTSSYGISVTNSSHVTIDGNDVSYAGLTQNGKTAKGIYLSGTTDARVANNVAHHNSDTGIYLASGSTRVDVVSNVAYSNASVYTRQANGIDVRNGGNTVAGNISHDNEDAGIRITSVTSTNVVANNAVSANGGSGINVLQSPGQQVVANSVYKNAASGIIVQGSSTGATLANNISVDNAINSTGAKGNLNVDSTSTSGASLDYDLIYQSTSGVVQVVWAGTNYTSLSSFVTARGQEAHGLQADPLWVSASTGDFHLRSGSPAIDSANSGANGQPGSDLEGRSRLNDPATTNSGTGTVLYADRGAYEFQTPTITFSGQGFQDVNGDALKSGGDSGLAGRVVFLDSNGNGVLDSGEASTTSDSSGNYLFTGLDAGTYQVATVVPTGWTQTTASPGSISASASGVYVNAVNFGSFQKVSVSGRVFQDSNGDGSQQTGESGLSGRTVYLDANNNGALDTGEATATTATNGNYTFTNLGPGTYHVRQVLPAGWQQTTTNPVDINASSGSNVSAVSFGAFQKVTLSGQVFQDTNGNGSQQTGEGGVSGQTVRLLDANGNVLATATTDSSGNYSFADLGPGTYRVRQVLPDGWLQTTADPADVTASSDSNVAGVNFGVFQQITISGRVFQDGDGAQGAGEVGLSGRTVYLDANNNGTLDTGEATATTDADGNYAFNNLGPGTYRVRQVVPAGWAQTTADPAAITASSGTDVAGIKFGAFRCVMISGLLFQDSDGDGTRETGEPGLSGWTVYLDANGNGTLDTGEATATTDSSGAYAFSNLGPGTYRVRQVLPAGWLQTTADPTDVTAFSGTDVAGLDFGAFQKITVSGLLFEDTNGDGARQTGEAGLSGWTVYLDANNNGALDADEASTVTDSAGAYSFTGVGPGTYWVRNVPVTGWTQTTANPDAFSAASGANVSNVVFGVFQKVPISGRIFQDSNGDGTQGTSEGGLSGWAVELLDSAGNVVATATTDADGNYSFADLGPGTYHVRQVLAAGWVQTTADPADVTASSGHNVSNVAFGVFQKVTISGLVFQDSDGDGTQGASEGGLSGWTVQLLDAAGNVVASTTTDADGNYSFAYLGPGTYRVRQVLPDGWAQTTADPADIQVRSGIDVFGVNLGSM
jgi:parallel beta-helix repeat protein